MLVYNIRKAKFADSLTASGVANRWNKQDEFVIYAGSSIALAALELLAHRAGIMPNQPYRLLTIKLDAGDEDVTKLDINQFPSNWKSLDAFPSLQELGSRWYQSQKTLLLQVPSVLVPKESNFVINTRHPHFFKKVSLLENETFIWDERLL